MCGEPSRRDTIDPDNALAYRGALAEATNSTRPLDDERGVIAGGDAYFVMDYISGESLDGYLDGLRAKPAARHSGADIQALLILFAKICEAVSAAHLRGVIHRDLKPGNISVDAFAEPH